MRRRHACYWRLLSLCIGLMISFALPSGWNRLSAIGYNLLPLVMIRGMGRPLGAIPFGPWTRRLYRGLGMAALASTPLMAQAGMTRWLVARSMIPSRAAMAMIRFLVAPARIRHPTSRRVV